METLRWANTERSMHFRETIMDPSMHIRKANTDLSMHFRKANFYSLFYSQLYSKFHFQIANLHISKSPIGPTKNLESLYNRVVGRSECHQK